MYLRPLLTGLLSYTPLRGLMGRHGGATASARYCYSVWLRHLVVCRGAGMERVPEVVAELGPGSSCGVGIAALLCGARHYYGLDVTAHAQPRRNLEILDQLVELFRARESIPGRNELPELEPELPSYEFPGDLLPGERLAACLSRERLEQIRRAVARVDDPELHGAVTLRYFAPWNDPSVVREGTVDLLLSQAVLEHVGDLEETYGVICSWLRPGAYMSHQVDFRCHGTARQWNGHWGYSPFVWNRLIKGRRSTLINRAPYSTHLRLQLDRGFEIARELVVQGADGLHRRELNASFAWLTDQDLVTRSAHLVSRKPVASVLGDRGSGEA